MSFRSYPEGGRGLFASLGHFYGMNQLDCRQVTAETAKNHWGATNPIDLERRQLPAMAIAILNGGQGSENQLVSALAAEMDWKVGTRSLLEQTRVFGKGERAIRLLHLPSDTLRRRKPWPFPPSLA